MQFTHEELARAARYLSLGLDCNVMPDDFGEAIEYLMVNHDKPTDDNWFTNDPFPD